MINRDFSKEFEFFTSRSSGPGGQNVNKVSSKVELRFNVTNSAILTLEEKTILLFKLKNKIIAGDILQIISQETRSQLKNKEICIEKFYSLLEKALVPDKIRKKVKPSKAMKEQRLKQKKIHSIKKILRNDKNFITDN